MTAESHKSGEDHGLPMYIYAACYFMIDKLYTMKSVEKCFCNLLLLVFHALLGDVDSGSGLLFLEALGSLLHLAVHL